ncbi:MAG: hypothetical protein FJ267_05900 [Planctomycetes bacterium]|nr:hypothetical protein [Planctomycetota bacterium]
MTLDIPGDFLNDGVYRIRVLLVEQSRVIVDLWDLVEFEVRDVERVGGWFGKWEGVVRPKLPWRTDREISE